MLQSIVRRPYTRPIAGDHRSVPSVSLRLLAIGTQERLGSLVRQAGWQRHHLSMAYTGLAARDLVQGQRFDLVLIALPLSDMDGLALCRQLRADGMEAPLILLSPRGSVDDCVAGFDAGADEYLVEPIAIEVLRARLTALLRRHGPLLVPIAL